ncbi:TetR/AcrR family transcriptional regulator [Rhodococcus opacus]|uniref:TetR/AcrR family transcriptional regulator n=1 Tax=Rhodococcus opacus TaxID=37919 RepID=UPI002473F052|nr:TetR/AcrR family transcriptional regulator [Rhodococcus opacus]MDH6288230.1 AcrR family transcriptional regulator [Rhodococcus opacus]
MSRATQSSGRTAILEAALSLIAKVGYEGMTISQLSTASGLPPSSIYYHFGSKYGVLAAVLEEGFREFHANLPSITDYEGDPFERFEQWFTHLCIRLNGKPDFLRLLITVCVERREDDAVVQETVRRIRQNSHDMWVAALTPIFAVDGSPEQVGLVDDLALLGRSVADGATIAESFDGTSHVRHVRPFVESLRGLMQTRQTAQTGSNH